LADGSRQYTFRLRSICDEAGNCWTGSQDYNHNVYSNTLNITQAINQNQIASGMADGSQRNFSFTLKDQYGNAIIPASGIGRTVDINVSGNNQLRLNQYNNTGNDSAIFADNSSTSVPIGTTGRSFNNRSSSAGTYALPFFVYAPTSNTDPFVPGSAQINITYDINSTTSIATGDSPKGVALVSGVDI